MAPSDLKASRVDVLTLPLMAERLGPYTLERRIGAGGMADVFLAKGPQGVCVVKRPHPHLCANPDFVRMFLSEAAILAQLNHPGIARIFDLGHVNDVYYLAMEYVPGFDLMTISLEHERQGELMAPDLCARIVGDAAGALHYAHEAKDRDGQALNIIHRDVSPHNILLSRTGEVKLIDFGVAKASNALHRTQAGLVKGKYPYMSPEQVTGQKIDRRVDVYALGLVLYELLTNVRAIQGNLEVEQIDNARSSRIRPIEQLRPNVPEPLRLILGGCLHPDPAGRYPTAQHLKEDLDKYLLYERKQVGQEDLLRLFRIVAAEVEVSDEAPPSDAQAAPAPTGEEFDETWSPDRKTEVEQPASAHILGPGVAASDSNLEALGVSRTEPSFKKPQVGTGPVVQPKSLQPTVQAPVQPLVSPLALTAPEPDTLATPSDGAGAVERPKRSLGPIIAVVVLAVAALAAGGYFAFADRPAPKPPPTGIDVPLEVHDAGAPVAETPPPPVAASEDAGTEPTAVAAVEVDAGAAEPPVEPKDPGTPPGPPDPAPAVDHRAAVVPVDTDPVMDIVVDGKKYGRSPTELELAPGQHKFMLWNKDENVRKYLTLVLRPGDRKPIVLRLKKGTLDLNATPFAAMFVNGVQVCPGLSHQSVDLYEGNYAVEFVVKDPSLPKEIRKKQQAEVKAGQTTSITVNMLQ